MMHVKLFIHPARVLAPCCLLALAACANPALNNQLANSREAVDQARIVGAEQAAPTELQAAVDKLNQASAAAEKRRNGDDAMRLAQEAQVDANLARARSDATHARMAAAELAKSNELLRAVHRENEKNGGAR
jgi:hypothetical protein